MQRPGQRDAYGQLMVLVRVLNDSLMQLCDEIIPELPNIAEPQRTKIANTLSAYALQFRDQLTNNGDFMRLAQTIELQTSELATARERLEVVRHDLRAAARSLSETSSLRTQLTTFDEHLTVIAKHLARFGPPVTAGVDDPILPAPNA